jgi:streptogramin lyase
MNRNFPGARALILPAVLAGIFLLPTLLRASGPITEFPVPTLDSDPWGITGGPDGNVWFCEYGRSKIGRITPDGAITEFPSHATRVPPSEITAGPDGNLWFAATDLDSGTGGEFGRISPSGGVSEFGELEAVCGITAGPDGNMWFTSCSVATNEIGRVTTPAGDVIVTLFPLPKGAGHFPDSITTGPDGNLWFTEPGIRQIGRMTTAGSVTEFPLAAGSEQPVSIVTGPDGNLWFAEGDKIGRITTGGAASEYPVAASAVVLGPDGNLWFADSASNKIGRLSIGADRVVVDAVLDVPTPNSGIFRLAAGPDGNVWFTESLGNKIGRVDLSTVCAPGALCLGGRFSITAAWTNGVSSGTSWATGITPNAGYFWFSDPSNPEVFVKILNFCPATGHFAVYVNGMTHLGVTVTVTDTRTGVSRNYVNPTGSPFSLIFDGSTFECP